MMNKEPKILTLANGLAVVTPKPSTHIDSAYLELTIRAGGRDDDNKHFGLAHFVEHTVAHVIESTRRQHQWVGDYMLDTFDAYTDQEKTTYYVAIAKEDLAQGIELLLLTLRSDKLLDAITKNVIDQEKTIVSEELLGSLDEESSSMRLQFAKYYYGANSLGRGDVLGTAETIHSFTLADVREFINQHYRPDNAFLVVTGNFDPVALMELGGFSLDGSATTQLPMHSTKVASLGRNVSQVLFHPLDTQQNNLMLARKLPKEGLTQSVALMILVGMLRRYLEFFGREKQIIYGIDVTNYPYRDHFSVMIDSNCAPSKTTSLCRWLFDSLEEFGGHLDEPALITYKESVLKNTRMELAYPRTALDTLAWYSYYFGEPLTVEQEMALIKDVTVDEVKLLYRKLLQGAGSTLMVSGTVSDELKIKIESIYASKS